MDDDASEVGAARDPGFLRAARPILERFASYFRPEVRGFDRLPEQGPMLVVGNHSGGQLPPDIPILLTAWWRERGEDPTTKLVIFSDGLDVDKIEELHAQFAGRVKVSFGWGTMLTNDFRGLAGDRLAPFSLVCKAVSANGRPTVKLSDNPNKAMGPADQIERYKRVFGVGEQQAAEVFV